MKAFLVDQREPQPPAKPLTVTTLRLRAAAIGYVHRLASLSSPSRAVEVIETRTGYRRASDELPRPKRALRVELQARAVAAIGTEGLADLRDRAILLLGFMGALRRSGLAAIRYEHLEKTEPGLRLTLPQTKGSEIGAVIGPLPYGRTELCPLCASPAGSRVWRYDRSGVSAHQIARTARTRLGHRKSRTALVPHLDHRDAFGDRALKVPAGLTRVPALRTVPEPQF